MLDIFIRNPLKQESVIVLFSIICKDKIEPGKILKQSEKNN